MFSLQYKNMSTIDRETRIVCLGLIFTLWKGRANQTMTTAESGAMAMTTVMATQSLGINATSRTVLVKEIFLEPEGEPFS